MKLIAKSNEMSKATLYRMANGQDNLSVKEVPDGEIIQVVGWITFEDQKDDGTTSELLSIIDDNGQIYVCQSQTFRREFFNIIDFMETYEVKIKKLSGESKAGRGFVTCTLAE